MIGQDVLASLRYTLDFKRRVIEWHNQTPVQRGGVFALSFEHGRFLVDLPQRDSMLRLVPDSGAGGLVLFNAPVSPAIVDTGMRVELSTVNGRRMARQVVMRELRLGATTLRDVPAVALDAEERHSSDGDGLLPLHLFDRVTFDGPARILILG